MGRFKKNRDFHEARWDEPIIMELGNPGERGVLVPKASERVVQVTGTVENLLPANLKRKKAPKLPEMSQMQVLRHYMRLSQETVCIFCLPEVFPISCLYMIRNPVWPRS